MWLPRPNPPVFSFYSIGRQTSRFKKRNRLEIERSEAVFPKSTITHSTRKAKEKQTSNPILQVTQPIYSPFLSLSLLGFVKQKVYSNGRRRCFETGGSHGLLFHGLILRCDSLRSHFHPPPPTSFILEKLHDPTLHMRRYFLHRLTPRLFTHPPRKLNLLFSVKKLNINYFSICFVCDTLIFNFWNLHDIRSKIVELIFHNVE